MERLYNTNLPISSLTGVRQFISSDDNSTNIKFQSKTNLEGLDNMIIDRQKCIQKEISIKNDINRLLISKLDKILSKKFTLRQEDYILLIDKFNLKKTGINRTTVKDMINMLNMQQLYYNKSNEKFTDISRNSYANTINNNNYNNHINDINFTENTNNINHANNNINHANKTSNINNINNINNLPKNVNIPSEEVHDNITPIFSKDSISKDSEAESLDKKLQNLINLRKEFKSPEDTENTIDSSTNINDNITENNVNISNTMENMVNHIYEDNISISNNNSRNENKDNHSPDKTDVTTCITSKTTNSDLELSIQNILKGITRQDTQKTVECNIMTNIISGINPTEDSQVCFKFDINYSGKKTIQNIVKIELVSCFVNENFFKKNDMKNSPYFLMKICEFNDCLYLNGSSVGGFCQIIWEKKGSHYSYINTDKIFGVYTPENDITLDTLNIELYDHNGTKLSKIKATENDQFNVVFKIITKESD